MRLQLCSRTLITWRKGRIFQAEIGTMMFAHNVQMRQCRGLNLQRQLNYRRLVSEQENMSDSPLGIRSSKMAVARNNHSRQAL